MSASNRNRIPSSVLTALLVFAVLLTAYHMLGSLWYPARLAYIMWVSGSHECSWDDAIRDHEEENSRRQSVENKLVLSEVKANLSCGKQSMARCGYPRTIPFPKTVFAACDG